MARAWLDPGTGDWGPVQMAATSCAQLGYPAALYGFGKSWVVVLMTGPAGSTPPTRSEHRVDAYGAMVPSTPQVTFDGRGRPVAALDALGEAWTVTGITGVWVRLGPVSAAAVRRAWRLRLACWHTPPPGVAGVVEVRGDGSALLRPAR